MARRLEVFTDGSCLLDPPAYSSDQLKRLGMRKAPESRGEGGWGWTTKDGRFAYGHVSKTTNNRMELLACIQAINMLTTRAYDDDHPLLIISDSKYVVLGMEEWAPKWERNRWRNASGKPVTNLDLVQTLYDQKRVHEVRFQWVKGHNGNRWNNVADRLANRGRVDQDGDWNLHRNGDTSVG